MERVFAIGDLHGHHKEFERLFTTLLNEAELDLDHDHLVLLGDLVDVGPNVKELLDMLIKLKEAFPNTFHALRGNHDDMLLDALLHNNKRYGDYYLWWKQGGKQTVQSYYPPEMTDFDRATSNPLDFIPKAHLDFLESLPLYWETDKYFFVHGGLPGKLSEIDLEDPDVQYQLLWIRAEFYANRQDYGKKVIFGHTGFTDHTNMNSEREAYEPYVQENAIGINTMPRNEGGLTCIELPTENFYFQAKL